jgi:hypothetical protein
LICERARKVDIRRWKRAWPVVTLPDGHEVQVVTTPCHFGHKRYWFLCPSCGRRCAILYPWVCRVCASGRYESESLSPEDRLMRRAFRLRERLGQRGGGLFGDVPERPRGMHRRTYERLVAQGEAIEAKLLEFASQRFGLPLDALI